jgi:methylated-DNA-[protein]-cysteine S-methyltransferase
MESFELRVLGICKRIPKGKVSTYKEIAKKVASPSSARAVGNALNKNKNLVVVPCHRVVLSSGFVGGYAKGTKRKTRLLKSEGVEISKRGKIDLKKYLF